MYSLLEEAMLLYSLTNLKQKMGLGSVALV